MNGVRTNKDRFNQSLTINQVGAKPLSSKGKTYYELGGGLFTKSQVLQSRRRYASVKYGVKKSPKTFGY